MTAAQSVLMGLVQGLTEFLPVSSSGHLALFKILFHVEMDNALLFDVLLHVGTLLAVLVVYWKDVFKLVVALVGIIADLFFNAKAFVLSFKGEQQKYRRIVRNSYRKLLLMLIVSTIPTAIIGLMADDLVEAASEMLLIPGICLCITAALLFISDRLPERDKRPKEATMANAFIIGICQGVATLPGISRSGTTITACLGNGFERKFAVKYSFLLSIPAILGALVLELKDFEGFGAAGMQPGLCLLGMVVAAVVGYICIKTMLVVVRKKKFTIFAIYCLAVGLFSIGGYVYML